MGRRGSEIIAFARANGGVISRRDALAMGMPSSTLHRWVANGHLVPVGHGVYVLPGVLNAERSKLSAATAALDAIVTHDSAGRLHGLDGTDPRQVVVSVPVRRSNRFADVTVHQLTDISASDTTRIEGLPVTNAIRTLIDLAATMRARRLAPIVDQAVRLKLTSYVDVNERLEELARRGKPGVSTMRSILKPRLGGTFVSDSPLESRLLAVLLDGGLPTPTTQFRPPWLRSVNGRVDLAYEEEKVIVEGDSRRWHGSPEAFQLDRHRDNLAQLAGWILLRFTWDDITKRPGHVVALAERALSTRRSSHMWEPQH